MLAQEIIRHKRDGLPLSDAQIGQFVQGLVDTSWSDAQIAAMAMAILIRGMEPAETVSLTRAMTHSGRVMDWAHAHLPGPVLDKHSSGGVGDKVSLMLAPMVAACGAVVPMVSGRGLGHTGGTLDKLSSIPGYQLAPEPAQLLQALRTAGCAIIGQSADVAPADRRLYAIRDVTGTVESVPLVTASILSKKLAAGLQGLVMDVKVGNGAFTSNLAQGRALAQSLVQVATGAGLPTRALLTDMNQVLGTHCGNVLEVQETIAFLRGDQQEARLLSLTRMLAAEMLTLGQLAATHDEALRQVDAGLASGRALEHFARMVHALGGPADLCDVPQHYLVSAPVQVPVPALASGWVTGMDTRAIGLQVIELGGGRHRSEDPIDTRVGLSAVKAVGQPVQKGEPLAWVHAADIAAANQAVYAMQQHIQVGVAAPTPGPLVLERVS